MGGVEDHGHAVRVAELLDALGMARRAEHVGGDERRGPVEAARRVVDVEQEVVVAALGEAWDGAGPRRGVGGGREREARHQRPVARVGRAPGG